MTTKIYPHEGNVFHTTQDNPGAPIIIKYPPYPDGTGRVMIVPGPTHTQHYQGSVNSIDHWNEWDYLNTDTDIDTVMHQVCRTLRGHPDAR